MTAQIPLLSDSDNSFPQGDFIEIEVASNRSVYLRLSDSSRVVQVNTNALRAALDFAHAHQETT